MSLHLTLRGDDQKDHTLTFDRLPDECPVCKKKGRPNYLAGRFNTRKPHVIRLAFQCPSADCQEIFSASYRNDTDPADHEVCKLDTTLSLRQVESVTLPESVTKISPLFALTFNQSHVAEANGLDQIAGPGYRKSLEFLVKDFLVNHVHPGDLEKENTIKGMFLGKCIEDMIDEKRIKNCAKRAAWLVNDETHYTRKLEEKDIHDLKSLINMTVNWIDLVIASDDYLQSMPDGK